MYRCFFLCHACDRSMPYLVIFVTIGLTKDWRINLQKPYSWRGPLLSMRGLQILTSATPGNQIFDSRIRKRKAPFSSTPMGHFCTQRGEFRIWVNRLEIYLSWTYDKPYGEQRHKTRTFRLVMRTSRYVRVSQARFRVSRAVLAWLALWYALVSRDTR